MNVTLLHSTKLFQSGRLLPVKPPRACDIPRAPFGFQPGLGRSGTPGSSPECRKERKAYRLGKTSRVTKEDYQEFLDQRYTGRSDQDQKDELILT